MPALSSGGTVYKSEYSPRHNRPLRETAGAVRGVLFRASRPDISFAPTESGLDGGRRREAVPAHLARTSGCTRLGRSVVSL